MAITPGGVVSAASYASGVAPGSCLDLRIESGGHDCECGGFRSGERVSADDAGRQHVTINGKAAYLNYVGPGQINLQVPADTSTGTVTVTVTNSMGSASTEATMQSALPGLFAASNSVLASRPSDNAIILGSDTVTARPGDVLAIYATGLGATTTAVAPGPVFQSAYPAASLPTVTIGGKTATVSYCGLVAAGLFQINLTVPSALVAGTHSVVVTQNGVSSPTSAVMKVTAN